MPWITLRGETALDAAAVLPGLRLSGSRPNMIIEGEGQTDGLDYKGAKLWALEWGMESVSCAIKIIKWEQRVVE